MVILNVIFRIHLLSFMGLSLVVLGIREQKLNWLEATRVCQGENKILDPMEQTIFPNLTHDLSMWTPNYVFNLGCETKDSGIELKLLYVNRVQQATGTVSGICHNRNTFRICNRTSNRSQFANITNMATLGQVMRVMEMDSDYSINSIDDTMILGENVGYCEVVTKFANRSKPFQRKEIKCGSKHMYKCAQGDNFTTVIRKRVSNRCGTTTGEPNLQRDSQPKHSSALYQLIAIVTAVLMLIGLVIIGCLIKRWMSKMQTIIMETLRQKYDHRMYDVERIDEGHELEPSTPISPGGTSLYENYQSESNPIQFLPNFNETFSYARSDEIRRPVTVHQGLPDTRAIDLRPRLTLPSRTDSRGNAVPLKSGPGVFLPIKQDQGTRTRTLFSNIFHESGQSDIELPIPRSDDLRRPVTTHQEFSVTQDIDSRPRLALPSRIPSRGYAVRQKSGMFSPIKQDRRMRTRTLSSDNSRTSGQSDTELHSVSEETPVIEKGDFSKCTPKPHPKPGLEERRSHGMTVRDISGEFAFYLGDQIKTRTESSSDEEYENIWEKSK